MNKKYYILPALFLMMISVFSLRGEFSNLNKPLTIELINPPRDTTVNCQNFKPFPEDIEANDDCPGDVVMTYFESSTKSTNENSCAHYNYVVTRIFTFSNECDEILNYTQRITVIDTFVPPFNVPNDVTVNCNDINDLSATGRVEPYLDQCGGTIFIRYEDDMTDSLCNAVVNRTWIVSDICGNMRTDTQKIMVIDTTSPSFIFQPLDITITCSTTPNPYPRFRSWLESFGNAVVGEDCNDVVNQFAAVPGSYDPLDPLTFPGEYPGILDEPDCEQGNGIIQSEMVDYVLVDGCGNVNVQQATFYYKDEVRPSIMSCGETIMTSISDEICDTTLTFKVPDYSDACAGGIVPITVSDVRALTSIPIGNTDVPVRDIVFLIGGYTEESIFDEENYFLVQMEYIDGDDPGETFYIYDEDNVLLRETPLVAEECDNIAFQLGPFSREKMEKWAANGNIQFLFNTRTYDGDPEASINLVCPLSRITITNTYNIERPTSLPRMFYSVDDGPRAEVTTDSISLQFNAGEHTVKFITRDCGGNESSCTKIVQISDNIGPEISCTGNKMFESGENNCEVPVPISDLISVSDDCGEEIILNIRIVGAMLYELSGSFNELKDSIIEFPPGESDVSFSAFDFSGNQDECAFEVFVRDLTLPEVTCKAIEFPVAAVALDQISVPPGLLVESASDNCGFVNINIIDNNYRCSDLNNTIGRSVRVSDNSGNFVTCIGNITFVEEDVPVSYSAGICPNDTLKFFLGIDKRPVYNYEWSGPSGFFSVEAEPYIPRASLSHEGIYSLTVTNTASGCVSTAEIDVNIADVRIPVFESDTIGCEAIPHEVISTFIPGNDIRYNWYRIEDNVEQLLEISEENVHYISLPPGKHTLFVIASNRFCNSLESNFITIDIREQPTVSNICERILEACIGDPLVLCIEDPQPTWNFRWFGPNEFYSEETFPVVAEAYDPSLSGVYDLVIEDNMCISDTLSTTVLSNAKPPKSTILGSDSYCAGDTIVLASSVIGSQYNYVWHSPAGDFKTQDPILRIPNASMQYSGPWCLSVELGPCLSERSDTLDVFIELQRNFEVNDIPTQCQGTDIRLLPTVIPNATYKWTGPAGFSSTEVSPEVLAANGNYSVTVETINGCIYTDEVPVQTIIRPTITGIDISEENDCIDSQDELFLIPMITQIQGLSFDWQGPNNYEANSPVVAISNFSTLNNGDYSLQVFNGDCYSDLYEFNLDYIIKPERPTLDGNSIACIGEQMEIISTSYEAGTEYFWSTPKGVIQTTSNRLILDDVTEDDEGQYSLQVIRNSCESQRSLGFNVTVNQNTFKPTVNGGGVQCVDESMILSTNYGSQYPVEWELPNGNIVLSDQIVVESAQVTDAGMYRARTFFNGCPSPWSEPIVVDIEDPRLGVSFIDDYIFSCNHMDANATLCINDESSLDGKIFQWYTNGNLIGETTGNCFPIQNFEAFNFGVNQVELRISYEGCVSNFSEVIFFEVENVLNLDINAGPDQQFCLNDELVMMADEPTSDNMRGYWSFEDKFNVEDINDPFTTVVIVDDLPRVNMIWTIEHDECGVILRDTVALIQKARPLAVNDTITSDAPQIIIPVVENDLLVQGTDYEITSIIEPKWGRVTRNGEVITFNTDESFVGGPILFNYELCDVVCPNLCDDADVVINYKLGSCRGNNVLTPNNDGVNDIFVIPCLDQIPSPENELVILNELGNVVFEQAPYDNSWRGTFNGEVLPEGTYYYIFRRDPGASVIQGFITIEK